MHFILELDKLVPGYQTYWWTDFVLVFYLFQLLFFTSAIQHELVVGVQLQGVDAKTPKSS